ncbi:MAG: hypothetical protein U0842_25815 [Candidatus Binatia bacterium]
MGVQITIRDVPEAVRDELATRAARARQSMQEFLLGELERLASRPTVDDWLLRVQARKRVTARSVPAKTILRQRDADRR